MGYYKRVRRKYYQWTGRRFAKRFSKGIAKHNAKMMGHKRQWRRYWYW